MATKKTIKKIARSKSTKKKPGAQPSKSAPLKQAPGRRRSGGGTIEPPDEEEEQEEE